MARLADGIALAIDFGTSNTAAAFRDRNGLVQEVRLSTAGSLMPSGVFYRGAQLLVGRTALQAAFTAPEAFEPSPKRRLSDREIFLAGDMIEVTDLVAAVFGEVLDRAIHVMGSEPDSVVVTHPEQWSAPLQHLLAESAIAGGVSASRLRLVSEAQAAAWFYANSAPDMDVGARLTVFDFGGGTCDVAVLERQPDRSFLVVATDGLNGLGGQDLDARIQSWVRQQLSASDPGLLAEVNNPSAIGTRLTLNDRIRDAKEALSEATSASVVVAAGSYNHVLQLTRGEFDELISADIARAVDLTKRVMADADRRRPSTQTPRIYLTGGSSHIPLVHARLAELGPLGVLGDPKTVVVEGALYTPREAPASPPAPPSPPPPGWPTAAPVPASGPAAAQTPLRRPPAPLAVTGGPPAGSRPPEYVALAPSPEQGPAAGGRGKVRKRWVIAGGGVIGAAIVTVTVLVATGAFNEHKPSVPPSLSPDKLSSLLLSTSEINSVMQTSHLVLKSTNNSLSSAGTVLSDDSCRGLIYAGELKVYSGSGYTAADDQILETPTTNASDHYFVEQTAVSYPTADAAHNFFNTSSDAWKSCAGKSLTATNPRTRDQFTWMIQNFHTQDTTLQVLTQQVGESWACQHALRAVSNVIVDVQACSHSVSNQADEIAGKMVANATSAMTTKDG